MAWFCRPSQPVRFYQGQQSLTGLIRIAVFEQRPSDGCAKPADRPVGSVHAGQGHQKQVWEQCCQHGKQLHTRHLNFNDKELSEKKTHTFDVTFQITPGPLKLSQGHQNWYKIGQPDKQVPKTRITVCEKQPLSKAWPWMASVMEGQTNTHHYTDSHAFSCHTKTFTQVVPILCECVGRSHPLVGQYTDCNEE